MELFIVSIRKSKLTANKIGVLLNPGGNNRDRMYICDIVAFNGQPRTEEICGNVN